MREKSKSILRLCQPQYDGVGAQLLRIFAAFAISKDCKMGFAYDLLKDIDNQVFNVKEDELKQWNKFLLNVLPIANDISNQSFLRINHQNHRKSKLYAVINTLDFIGIPAIHVINSPQAITNKDPRILGNINFEESIKKYRKPRKHNTLRVVLHIRQGELGLSQFRDRYLPLAYFESFLSNLLPRLNRLGINYDVTVTVEPGQNNLLQGEDPKIIESIKLDPSNPHLINVKNNFFRIQHEKPTNKLTPYLKKAKWLAPATSWADFQRFLSADILVLSKSSFSYLAGVLNGSAIVVCPEFWHPLLPGWHSTQNIDEIIKRLL